MLQEGTDPRRVYARRGSVPSCNISKTRELVTWLDRKSTRLNSSHDQISYAVFCLKKKKPRRPPPRPTDPDRAASGRGRTFRGELHRPQPDRPRDPGRHAVHRPIAGRGRDVRLLAS